MSVVRGSGWFGRGGSDLREETSAAQVEERRSVRSGVVCAGSLACRRCDAPVSTGGAALTLTEDLVCPFCGHGGPVREFLSLARPTRPARVVVRVSGLPSARR